MVNLTEARKDLLSPVFIGNIHHDPVHLPQLQLGFDEFLLGAARNRDLRALVPGQAGGGQANPAAATDDHEVATFQLQCTLR
jgi:hypothetical protein